MSRPESLIDLSQCDREPIHLIGTVQPHGLLLVVDDSSHLIVQASRNASRLLGRSDHASLLGQTLSSLGGDLSDTVLGLARQSALNEPVAVQVHCRPTASRQGEGLVFEGAVFRAAPGRIAIELEPSRAELPGVEVCELGADVLAATLATSVQGLSAASTTGLLADTLVQAVRELTGYDRVMVYKFDPDGHGKVIAESRHPKLESLLGHHYPATDIPQQARALYLRNRVRMLVSVDDVTEPIEPPTVAPGVDPLDLSMSSLRGMSPVHLQYLRNMGVTASCSASLVREGQLWGLVAAHHHGPRYLRRTVRASLELLSEVASTRISAIENYAHAQVALMVRRLEQRLVEATSTEGDWRYALFRSPRTLLQPLDATGAVLFHDGEILTCGEVPSTPELRALVDWVETQAGNGPFACASVGKAEVQLQSLTPTASGVLAVRLSTGRPDYLMWLRKEQLQTVTWAGDPSKPVNRDDPMSIAPRQSFAAWSEVVRGTAVPWSSTEVALARAIGVALVDIIVQVHAVRLLIAEHQRSQIRSAVSSAREPVLVADHEGRAIFSNAAFLGLSGRQVQEGTSLAGLFEQSDLVEQSLQELRAMPQPWRRDLDLLPGNGGEPIPVTVRAESVSSRDGLRLGFILTFVDLRENRRTQVARDHLEAVLAKAGKMPADGTDEVVRAILNNASLAAMDIAEARSGPPAAPLLYEIEESIRRSAALYAQVRRFLG